VAASPCPQDQASVKNEYAYAGLSSTCFFLPIDSLMTPSGVRLPALRIIFSSVTATSLTRSPPPLIWRRASPLEATRPALTYIASTPTPASSSPRGISTVGRLSAIAPSSKVCRAVSDAELAASRPCSSAVASVASTFLASLLSPPCSAASLLISLIGRIVKSFRNLTTSASSTLRQYCQKSYGENWSALSQTAPCAVLPILAPEAVVSSGVVSANNCGVPMRRPRSTPLTMLPHWSEPPICSRQPARRASSTKS